MATLFDGLVNVDKVNLAKHVTELETYRFGVYMRCLLNKPVHKNKSETKSEPEAMLQGMEAEDKAQSDTGTRLGGIRGVYQENLEKNLALDMYELRRKHQELLAAYAGTRFKRDKRADADKLDRRLEAVSAKLTREAVKALPVSSRRGVAGKSISEVNDYIFGVYPGCRREDFAGFMTLWLVCMSVIAVAMCAVTSVGLWQKSLVLKGYVMEYMPDVFAEWLYDVPVMYILLYGIIAIVIGEVYISYILRRKLKGRLILKNVWLATSHHGRSFSVNLVDIALRKCDEADRIFLEDHMMAYHSMVKMSEGLSKKLKKLNNDYKLAKRAGDSAEVASRIDKLSDMIAKQQESIEQISQIAKDEEKKLTVMLSDIWSKAYPEYIFKDDFIKRAVNDFSFEDLEIIDSRLLELARAKNPWSLTVKSMGKRRMSFVAKQGDMSAIYFGKEKKKLVVAGLGRDGGFAEKMLSPDDIDRILSSDSEAGNKDVQMLMRLHSQLENSESELESARAGFAAAKKELGRYHRKYEGVVELLDKANAEMTDYRNVLGSKQGEIKQLYATIRYKQKEIEELEKRLEDASTPKEDVIRYKQLYQERNVQLLEELEVSSNHIRNIAALVKHLYDVVMGKAKIIGDMENYSVKIEQEKRRYDSQIQLLRQRKKDMEEVRIDLSHELMKKDSVCEGLNALIETNSQIIDRLESSVEANEIVISDLEAQVKAAAGVMAVEELEETKQKLNRKLKENDALKTNKRELIVNNSRMRKELAGYIEIVDYLTKNNDDIQLDIDARRMEYNELIEEYNRLKEVNDELLRLYEMLPVEYDDRRAVDTGLQDGMSEDDEVEINYGIDQVLVENLTKYSEEIISHRWQLLFPGLKIDESVIQKAFREYSIPIDTMYKLECELGYCNYNRKQGASYDEASGIYRRNISQVRPGAVISYKSIQEADKRYEIIDI